LESFDCDRTVFSPIIPIQVLKAAMQLILPAAIFVLMVSVGMSLHLHELADNWKRLSWTAWLRLVLASFILPAAIALILARIFPLSLHDAAGLFMVGATPGAPLLTRNLARRGFDMQLAASYQVWSGMMTPILVPPMLWAAARLYDRYIWIPPRVVLGQIVLKEFLPLLVGMALMHFAPRFSKKVQRGLNIVGNLTLTLVFIALLWKVGPELKTVTPWIVLATLLLLIASVAVMHLLMRADRVAVRTLAVSNGNRHVGLALLLSGRYLHSRNALPVIACYAILVAILVVLSPRLFPAPQRAEQATA
jgi:BASS family bile acid:Na+ symporter